MKKTLLLTFSIIVLDQLTKFTVDKFISYNACVTVIPFFNFLNITNIHNSGMAFGLLQGKNLFFLFIILFVLAAVSLWLYKYNNKISKIQKYAICLIIAGGSGNLIDRLFRSAVVDFLDFGINSLRYPAFNIADSCICTAMLLILIDTIKNNSKIKT
jgi:signal peptidase II